MLEVRQNEIALRRFPGGAALLLISEGTLVSATSKQLLQGSSVSKR